MKWLLIGYYVLVAVILMITCIKKAYCNESFKGFLKEVAISVVFSLFWLPASLIVIAFSSVTRLLDYISLKQEERFKATREDVGLGG